MPTLARNWRLIAILVALACVLAFALFEVRLRPELSWPGEVERPDPSRRRATDAVSTS